MPHPLFSTNQQVRKKSNRDNIGVVIKHTGIRQQIHWYKVNFNGRIIVCPEHDLELFVGDLDVESEFVSGNFGSKKGFSKLLTYKKLISSIRNNIYALYASKTEFHAYQYKPLLKFLESPDQRLLIADEVGLGKTIESGLILIEQRARNPISRILIVCPSSLTRKWRDEMRIRFDEEFEIMNKFRLEEFLEDFYRDGNSIKLRGICSLQLLRNKEILAQIDETNPSFDLVVIDEAHHLRNYSTLSNRMGRLLATLTDGMILLTATPIHLGSEDLFNLFKILRPGEYENFFLFQRRLNLNKYIIDAERAILSSPPNIQSCLSSLKELRNTEENERFENDPVYCRTISHLEDDQHLSSRRKIIELHRDINSLSMTSNILTRTRKREFQKLSKRTAQTLSHNFTPEEKRFYDAVTSYVRSQYEHYGYFGIGVFVAMNYQRQVASCIPAMVKHYQEQLQINGNDSEVTDLEIEDWISNNNYDEDYQDNHKELLELIESCQITDGIDSKYDNFVEQIKKLEHAETGRKILIFSYYKKTLNYLSDRLSMDGLRNVVIHGDVEPQDRYDLIDKFREDSDIKILLSSEVGSEGLDFQFCHIMVNYDLPWNPMKVEQRIGRLDRFGQKSDRIIILNIVTSDTIEERILNRLYNRINIFTESIGDLEPILGEKLHNLHLELLKSHLDEGEESERIKQVADAIERERQQTEKLEKESTKLIGFDDYFNQELGRLTKYKNFISDDELKVFLEEYLIVEYPNVKLYPQKNPKLFKIRIPLELLNQIKESTLPNNQLLRKFLNEYYKQNRNVLITFNSEEANKNKTIEFINSNHPLIQMIVKHYEFKKTELHPVSKIKVKFDKLPSGYYFYFVYLIEFSGAREEKRLENIVVNSKSCQALTDELADELIGVAKVQGSDIDLLPSHFDMNLRKSFDIAYETAHNMREERGNELRTINDSLIAERIGSLQKSFNYKIGKAKLRLETAREKKSDHRIIRMTESQIRNLEDEKERKINEMEMKRTVSSSLEVVAAGVIVI